MGTHRERVLALAGIVLAIVLTGCGAKGDAVPDGTQPVGGTTPSGKITVFAAASLTEAFNEIARAFKEAYPGAEIDFNFAGTPTLRTQLEQGARADVFASANLEQMDLAKQSGVVEQASSSFARNSLVIITPSDNPAKIESPADLARDGLKLVLAQEDVPVGAYTRQALTAMAADASFEAGFSDAVLGNVVSLESNVKQVVAKVELGEADAGIVYGTDVTPEVASKLYKIEIPDAFNVIAEYPAALTTDRSNEPLARAFIDFLLSAEGQAILTKYGFLSVG
jgi:molybdate transport system substrate-binding protein